MRFLAVCLVASSLSMAAALTPLIAEWKKEIEKHGGVVTIVRIPTEAHRNEISLPEDTPFRPILRKYFLDPNFVTLFAGAHALNLNYDGPEGRIHFVLLNEALSDMWTSYEEAVVGHELGHIWLQVRGYEAALLRGRASDCTGIQATDIVQHMLIRSELELRGIEYRRYWLTNLERALAGLSTPRTQPAGACQQLAQIALWVDVALGLTSAEWPDRDPFLDAMLKRFPEIETAARSIEALLRDSPMDAQPRYRAALMRTYGVLSVHAGKAHQ